MRRGGLRHVVQVIRSPDVLLSLAVLLIGLVGLVQRFAFGKSSTALGSYVTWGLWVGLYVYLVWLEIGSLLVYAVATHIFRWKALVSMRRLVYFVALIILTMALVTIAVDLGHPFRFWRVYTEPAFSSPLTWMVWLHTAYLVLLVAELRLVLRPAHEQTEKLLRVLSWVSIPLGIALITAVGMVFGVVAARPYWSITLLPLVFFTTSLVTGVALLTFLYVWFWRPYGGLDYEAICQQLRRILLGSMIVALYVAVVNLVLIFYSAVPSRTLPTLQVFTGPYSWSFWIYHGLLGIVVPFAILSRRLSSRWIGAAAFLVIATFIMVPLNVVIPAQVETQLPLLTEAYVHKRLSTAYFPTVTEWLFVVFVVGFGLSLFSIGKRALPVLKPDQEVSS